MHVFTRRLSWHVGCSKKSVGCSKKTVPVIAPFVERWYLERVSLTHFNSTLGNSIKSYISVVVFLKKGVVRDTLQKAVATGPFVEHFKAVL